MKSKLITLLNKTAYAVLEHKLLTTAALAVIMLITGFLGFLQLIKEPNLASVLDAAVDTVALFSLNKPEETNILIDISRVFTFLTLFVGAAFLLIKDVLQGQIVKTIIQQKHTLVCGLGENNRYYLESEIDQASRIVIVEQNSANPYLEAYRAKGFGVLIGDILDQGFWEKVSIYNLESFIVSTGDDRRNIEAVTSLLAACETYDDKSFGVSTKVHVHIVNRDLNVLFQQEVLAAKRGLNLEVVPFSFYEDASKQLFNTHSVLGSKNGIIHTEQPYQIAVVGSGELAANVVYQICKIAHLPNRNELTLYCIDKEADAFVQQLHRRFRYIDRVPNIHIQPVNADSGRSDFYEILLWHEKNLTNVIICRDEEQENLEIALSLYDKTYLVAANEMTLQVKVLFAVFQEMELSRKVNENKAQFRQFHTFANARDICSYANLIDEQTDAIAKLIHLGYGDTYNPDKLLDLDDPEVKSKIDTRWFAHSRMSDKESSRAQAQHIDIKLRALGLTKVPAETGSDQEKLLVENRALFEKHLGERLDDNALEDASRELDDFWAEKPYAVRYFPQHYTTLFEKIVHAEHDRWNALHYLNGWVYEAFDGQDQELKAKMKKIKHHNCLLTLEEFVTPSTQITLIYDVYALLYIPNYLANTGYLLAELEI